ncbi:hypothetical protein D9757_007751 [Collybiopsis confluens]|uniref:Major facilitator superfamily (MFS) profile domain-containing protein n=1 Tax=Collybiopsis confluens TaxID=2823264 RepID=A0A8H5H5E4_9AGAR|nr:hypothetical protein D9757_007751 [Collybiopsis confluens]
MSTDNISSSYAKSAATSMYEDDYSSKFDNMDPVEWQRLERQAVRRMDLYILPIMSMFYFLSFLDRSNIGNARVAGLEKSLNMTDYQYEICITVLYVDSLKFATAEDWPKISDARSIDNVGSHGRTPRLVLGVVTSFAGLVTVRAFIGAVEGPMFPGIVLYLSTFYTRKELATRVAVFFSTASLSGAFSGLLAAAIVKMNGIGGRPGWAYIFILEGSFSILMGLLGFLLVPSTVHELRFMTPEMKELLIRRLARDNPSATTDQDKFSFREVARSLKSPHVLIIFAMFYFSGTLLFGQALFLPSIVNQLGFSPNRTQLLSVGPFATGFLVTLVVSTWSDRMKSRAVPTMMISLLALAGFSLYLGTLFPLSEVPPTYPLSIGSTAKFTRYGSLFLTVPGIYAAVPAISAWMSNNSEPHYRRATSIALGFIATNAGGITSTWLFPSKEAPNFRRATIINITFSLLIILGAGLNAFYLDYMNKQKIKNRDQILAPYNLESDDVKRTNATRAWVELGDRHPDFKYTL